MSRLFLTLCLGLLCLTPAHADEKDRTPNTLTKQEIADGWILLFDGETTFGWKVEGAKPVIKQGVLVIGGDEPSTVVWTSPVCDGVIHFESMGLGAQETKLHLNGNPVGHTLEMPVWQPHRVTIQDGRLDSMSSGGGSMGLKASGRFDTPDTPRMSSTLSINTAAGKRILLRNIRFKPTAAKPIFNGQDLTGWKAITGSRYKSKFSVTDKGELNIKDGPGDLQSEEEWDDFILQLDVISNGKHLNSGIFFRCVAGQFWSGYEAQVRNQWQGEDRAKPVDFGTGGLYNRQPARKVVSSDGEYFTMTVIAHGGHIAIWVNGYQTVDFTDTAKDAPSPRQGRKLGKGPISLQGHDPTTDLSFKNLRVAPLAKPSPEKQ